MWEGCACTSCNPWPATTSDHHSIFVYGWGVGRGGDTQTATPCWMSWRPRVAVFWGARVTCRVNGTFRCFWSWCSRYSQHQLMKFTRKMKLSGNTCQENELIKKLLMKTSFHCRGSDTSPFSPPVTFPISCCFAQRAVTYLLWTRTTKHNDLIRRVVPGTKEKDEGSDTKVWTKECCGYFCQEENGLASVLPPQRHKL